MVKLLHLKDIKSHNEISISLYKSSSHGEEILFDHPLLFGLMEMEWSFIRALETVMT